MDANEPKSFPKKGIYLLPNLLTLSGLFAGFYSIVASLKGLFDTAAWVVFIGMIFDGLDGRVARLINAQSEFGAQLDSLADLVTFGVAPSLLVYSWGLSGLGKVGWLCAFLFMACGALRLARFNTMSDEVDPAYFQGLPIPAGAAIVTSFVWALLNYGISGHEIGRVVAGVTAVTGLLMVSNVPYYSFKTFHFKGKVPFANVVIMLLLIVAVAMRPDQVIFYTMLLYVLSGIFWLLIRKMKGK